MRTAAWLAAAALLFGAQAHAQDGAARLTVLVTGADAGVGQIKAGLYSGEASYAAAMGSRGGVDPLQSATAAVDAEGRATLVFAGLAAGEYAVTVHYDRDGDGVMDTGLLGIPREKVAFSNNARLRFGPPSWDEVRFDVGAEPAEITVALKQAENE